MRRRNGELLGLIAVLLAACSPGPDQITSGTEVASVTEEVATDPAGLVIERRPMTTAERARLDRDDPQTLDCDDVGEAFWDYDASVAPGTPGRTADDALLEVIIEFNDDARTDPRTPLDYDFVPLTGWIELTDGDWSTFVHTNDNWRFAIQIRGDAGLNNWRPHGARMCQPGLDWVQPDA